MRDRVGFVSGTNEDLVIRGRGGKAGTSMPLAPQATLWKQSLVEMLPTRFMLGLSSPRFTSKIYRGIISSQLKLNRGRREGVSHGNQGRARLRKGRKGPLAATESRSCHRLSRQLYLQVHIHMRTNLAHSCHSSMPPAAVKGVRRLDVDLMPVTKIPSWMDTRLPWRLCRAS